MKKFVLIIQTKEFGDVNYAIKFFRTAQVFLSTGRVLLIYRKEDFPQKQEKKK